MKSSFSASQEVHIPPAPLQVVCNAGLLEARFMDAFHDMYAAFQANTDGTPFRETKWVERRIGNLTANIFRKYVKIKAVGVWDTVGSLGLPEIGPVSYFNPNKAYRFHNTMLDEGLTILKLTLALLEADSRTHYQG